MMMIARAQSVEQSVGIMGSKGAYSLLRASTTSLHDILTLVSSSSLYAIEKWGCDGNIAWTGMVCYKTVTVHTYPECGNSFIKLSG